MKLAEKKNRSKDRADHGIVEQDFERQTNDEVVESGEHIDHDLLEDWSDSQAERGAPIPGTILHAPSDYPNPYMSPEEQALDMTPEIVGPPAYGSPDPVTSAGKLAVVRDHPLRAEVLPEDAPAALSEDYGADIQGAKISAREGTHPGVPAEVEPDLYADTSGRGANAPKSEEDYEEMNVEELKDLARQRGISGYSQMNKADLVEAHVDFDSENE